MSCVRGERACLCVLAASTGVWAVHDQVCEGNGMDMGVIGRNGSGSQHNTIRNELFNGYAQKAAGIKCSTLRLNFASCNIRLGHT